MAQGQGLTMPKLRALGSAKGAAAGRMRKHQQLAASRQAQQLTAQVVPSSVLLSSLELSDTRIYEP